MHKSSFSVLKACGFVPDCSRCSGWSPGRPDRRSFCLSVASPTTHQEEEDDAQTAPGERGELMANLVFLLVLMD